MKTIKIWNEIERRTAADGSVQIQYQAGRYHVVVSEASYMQGGYSISVYPARGDYLPEIYVDGGVGMETQSVTIQTTSWGALSLSEIDSVVAGLKEAQSLAHQIVSLFPECFE